MLCLLVSLITSSHLKKISIPISIHIYLLLQVSRVMCAMTVATTLQNVAYLSNLISHTSKKKKASIAICPWAFWTPVESLMVTRQQMTPTS